MQITELSLLVLMLLPCILQAAMFNFTEITFMLMDAGANMQAKNAQGMEQGETVYTRSNIMATV